MEMLLAVVVISVSVLFVVGNNFDILAKKVRWWNRNRLLRKNAVDVICTAINEKWEMASASLYLKPPLAWVGKYETENVVRKFIPEFMIPSVSSYQAFFNQLLKRYADDLQSIYDQEEALKKKYSKARDQRDYLSQEEIIKALQEDDDLQDRKYAAEDNFWRLHDTLDLLGLKTWGHKSYKIYVLLKPVGFEVTLKNVEL